MEKLVYIVEDNEIQQRVLKKHFDENFKAYNIKAFTDPNDMLREIGMKPYAIILDHLYDNCEHTGLHFLNQIKRFNKSIPIIYYTTINDEQLKNEVLKKGAFSFIEKNSASLVKLRTCLDDIQAKKENKSFWGRLFS